MKVSKIVINSIACSLLAFIVFIPSLTIGLIADDYRNIETAEYLTIDNIKRDIKYGSPSGPHYRPMEPISYRVDRFIWKDRSVEKSSHLTNMIIHAVCTFILFQIVNSLFNSNLVATTASVLFAVHPVSAAATGWISGRTSGMVCLFLLMSTWMFIKFFKDKKNIYLFVSTIFFGLALLTKEQAYLFPAFLFFLILSESIPNHSIKWPTQKQIVYCSIAFFIGLIFVRIIGIKSSFLLELLVAYAFIIALTMKFYPKLNVLIYFVFIEFFVIIAGVIPSGALSKLNAADHITNPISFSTVRLSKDLYVLCSAMGIIDFSLRDRLINIALHDPWVINIIWFITVLFMIGLFYFIPNKKKYLAALIWFLIAISPLRGLYVVFFDIANLYLAIPIIVIFISIIIKKLYSRYSYISGIIGISIGIIWMMNLLNIQMNLKEMGKFSHSLHTILERETKETPGPLRVIINVPDPLRISEDENLAHFLVFRIVQSAMELGGYSKEKINFVEGRVVQIVAVDHGEPCNYEARIIDNNNIFIRILKETNYPKCSPELKFVDFSVFSEKDKNSIIVSRLAPYEGFPLTEAEIYAFDGNKLHLLVEQPSSEKISMYDLWETSVTNVNIYSNKFKDVELNGTFTSPTGEKIIFPGFYDGDGNGGQSGDIWKQRFMCNEIGTWTYTIAFSDGAPGKRGSFRCIESGAKPGPWKQDPDNPHWFMTMRGKRFFPIMMHAYIYFTPVDAIDGIKWAKTKGYNTLITSTFNTWAWGDGWPNTLAWATKKSSNSIFQFIRRKERKEVDYNRMNLKMWHEWDDMFKFAASNNIYIGPFGGFEGRYGGQEEGKYPPNELVYLPGLKTYATSEENKWMIRYLVARQGAFWNLAYWSLAGTEVYEKMDRAGFIEYAEYFASITPFGRMITSQDVEQRRELNGNHIYRKWLSESNFPNSRKLNTLQNNGVDDPLHTNAGPNNELALESYHGFPIIGTETLWEGQVRATKPLRIIWGYYTAGAHTMWADWKYGDIGLESDHRHGSIGRGWIPVKPLSEHMFRTTELGVNTVGDKQLLIAAGELNKLEYWMMWPHNEYVSGSTEAYCLAEPGRQYLIYAPIGGSVTLNLLKFPGTFQAKWIDPRQGGYVSIKTISGAQTQSLSAPDSRDWVLIVLKIAPD